MRNIWLKLKSAKKSRYLILIPVLALAVLIAPNTAHAVFIEGLVGIAESSLLSPVHAILLAVVAMLGALMQAVMYLLVAIAQYDGFANAPAIGLGWSMIRDLCNMAIVAYLLYIAFQYALNLGHVELDKSLVNLVLVAIGVNFSKTITLMLVDISQVVMLTFVNSFKNIGVAELYRIMNIGSFFNMTPGTTTSSLATEFFTIIIMIVVLTVLALLMAILIVRVVAIWIHIILSPIFIAGWGVSWLHSYQGAWWKQMKEYLLIGPCLAFFIWLTFASMQGATTNALVPDPGRFDKLKLDAKASSSLGEIGTVDKLAGLALTLAMLLGGVSICATYAKSMPFGLGKKLTDWSKGAARFAGTKLPVDALRRTSRVLGRASANFKDKEGNLTTLGKGLSITGAGIGGAVRVGRGVKEFLAQPGTIAKGLYEEYVTGNEGAAQSALTTARDTDLKNARAEQDKKGFNVDALQKQWETAKKGGYKDMTQPQIMALFEAVDKKGGFKTPDEFLNAMEFVEKSGKDGILGMPSMTVQWDKEQREKKFGKDSVHSTPGLKMKDGKAVSNVEANIEKAFEISADRNEDNFFENAKNQELNTVGMFGKSAVDDAGYLKTKDKDGKPIKAAAFTAEQFADPVLQSKISFIMGSGESDLSKNRSKINKRLFNQNLGNLLQASTYEEGGVKKSRLTPEQIKKVESLMAATLIDGDKARKFAREGGDLDQFIKNTVDNARKGEINLGVDRGFIDVQGRSREEGVDLDLINKADDLLREGPKKSKAEERTYATIETPKTPKEIEDAALKAEKEADKRAAAADKAAERAERAAERSARSAPSATIRRAINESPVDDIRVNIIRSAGNLGSEVSAGLLPASEAPARLDVIINEMANSTSSNNITMTAENGLQDLQGALVKAKSEIESTPDITDDQVRAILDKYLKE